jgi:ABC-type sugar transport system permease subunit
LVGLFAVVVIVVIAVVVAVAKNQDVKFLVLFSLIYFME